MKPDQKADKMKKLKCDFLCVSGKKTCQFGYAMRFYCIIFVEEILL